MLVSRTCWLTLVHLLSLFCLLSLAYLFSPLFCLFSDSLCLCFSPPAAAALHSKWNQIWLWVSGSLSIWLSLSIYSALVFWPHCQKAVFQHTHTLLHISTPTPTLPYTPTQYALEHVVYVHKFDAPLYNVIPIFIYAYFWENKEFYTRLSCCAIYRHFSLCFCQLHLQLFLVNLLNIFPNVLQNLL